MGVRTLRRPLTIEVSAVIKQASLKGAPTGSWLAQMLARKPKMFAAQVSTVAPWGACRTSASSNTLVVAANSIMMPLGSVK